MATQAVVEAPDGTRLCVKDFGGRGPAPVLLLHGLAGYAGEWAGTAERLSGGARAVAFGARGHGGSDRRPADVWRHANVADAVAVIEAMRLAPAVLVGRSLGGQTALLVAAERPDLVRGLVVAEASPDPGDRKSHVHVERSLRSWPVPFATRARAVDYFAAVASPRRRGPAASKSATVAGGRASTPTSSCGPCATPTAGRTGRSGSASRGSGGVGAGPAGLPPVALTVPSPAR